MKKYEKVAVGGTFDRLHKGHEAMLNLAFESGETIVVGITSDIFVIEKVWSDLIQPFETRKTKLEEWLDRSGYGKSEIVVLDDMYGTTLSDDTIDALVVSQETKVGGEKVNTEREKNDMTPLPLLVSEMVFDEKNEVLSSSNIRKGLVNRQGMRFDKLFEKDIKVNAEQLFKLKKPLGKLLIEVDTEKLMRASMVCVVGDVSAARFRDMGWRMNLEIVDGKSQREVKQQLEHWDAANPAGWIMMEAIKKLFGMIDKGGGKLIIEGEEDLLVLPTLLLAPLESLVYYGQPGEGMVEILVTEELKAKWYQFLKG